MLFKDSLEKIISHRSQIIYLIVKKNLTTFVMRLKYTEIYRPLSVNQEQ